MLLLELIVLFPKIQTDRSVEVVWMVWLVMLMIDDGIVFVCHEVLDHLLCLLVFDVFNFDTRS